MNGNTPNETVKKLRDGVKAGTRCGLQEMVRIADLIESQAALLDASQRRERAHEAAIKRHYADMTSQCFICYSCVNHDAREKAQWDGKKLENYACSGCGSGKPKWQFDVGRFSQEVAK